MADTQFIPPLPPHNFTLVDPTPPGTYLVGHDQFTPASFPLTTVFHRELTPADDFLLGILSVILIAVVSDVAHSVLLRTTSNRVTPTGLYSAFLVSEATHMRNVVAHLRASFRVNRSYGSDTGPKHPAAAARMSVAPPHFPVTTTSPFIISAVVLVVLTAIFVADVVIVVVTQPRPTRSSATEYNLRAVQPVQMREGLARYIRRMASDRTCVTPVVVDAPGGGHLQLRRYLLTSCIRFDQSIDPRTLNTSLPDVSKRITLTSYFHRGGSDHNVSFDSGWMSVSVRVQAVMDNPSGGPRRLLFDSLDDADQSHAKYLHALFVHKAKEYLCTKDFSKAWCATSDAKPSTEPISSERVEDDVFLWRGTQDDTLVRATGLVSVFDENLSHGFRACNSAIRVLLASAIVQEVRGPAAYERAIDDVEEAGVPNLLAEEERMAGVALLGSLTAGMLILMSLLRCWLKPASLGELAFVEMERGMREKAPGSDPADALSYPLYEQNYAEPVGPGTGPHAGIVAPEETFYERDTTDPMFGLGAGDLPGGGPAQVREYDDPGLGRAGARQAAIPAPAPVAQPPNGLPWRVRNALRRNGGRERERGTMYR